MAEFSYQIFEKEFSEARIELEKAFQERDHLKTISYLRFLLRGYCILNYKMTDDRLEEILKQTSLDLLGETVITNSRPDTVALVHGAGVFSRGLAKIYVDALAQLGYQVVWIVQISATDLDEIQQYCERKENISVRVIPKAPILERMRLLQTIIKEIAPRHLFVYPSTGDVCSIGVSDTIKGDVTRYYIDAGDHVFWLGKCAADYFIGFRNWSYNVEKQLRGIRPEQLIILPYYPNSRAQYPYEGMPFDEEKHEFIFSGGASYKIEGDSTYQEMVEYILIKYPEIKFVYASKETNPILESLMEKYPNQFFHIEERRDLDEVLKRAKLYLGTYPLGGGLMTQYAAENQCIPLCLTPAPDDPTDPKTWLLNPDKADFVFYKKEELLSALDRLIDDPSYFEKVRSGLAGQVISEQEFAEQLQRILTEHQTKFKKQDMPVNLDHFLAIYKRRADYNLFCEIIYKSHNDWIKRKYPKIIEEMDARKRDGTL